MEEGGGEGKEFRCKFVGVVFDQSKGTNELFRMAKEIKNGGGESRLVSSWRSLI